MEFSKFKLGFGGLQLFDLNWISKMFTCDDHKAIKTTEDDHLIMELAASMLWVVD